MRWSLAGSFAFAVVAGCGGEVTVSELDLDLVADGLSCISSPFLTVRSIAVEAIGETNDGPCRLAQRCISTDGSTSVNAVEQDLAEASQPLLDVGAGRLVEIRVSGYEQIGCGGDRATCGAADVASAEEGVLVVSITCDSLLFADACGDEAVPSCP